MHEAIYFQSRGLITDGWEFGGESGVHTADEKLLSYRTGGWR